MTKSLLSLSRRVRLAPGINRADWLWRRLSPVFYRTIDPLGRGVQISVGHGYTKRVPSTFASAVAGWSSYEKAGVDAVVDWIRRYPAGQMIDLGCALGMFSALALQHSRRLRVVAIDSDLASLAYARKFAARDCERLSFVWGLVESSQPAPALWPDAIARTAAQLRLSEPQADLRKTRYQCLADTAAAEIPHYSLDALGVNPTPSAGPTLIKCDVEGAELHVLRGAKEFLGTLKPHLLLSVHPAALPSYGHSRSDVEDWLRAAGYRWRLIDRDHEEHWWCGPSAT